MAALVFIYGSLRRGASNAWRMKGAEYLGQGEVKGQLYQISSCPGLVVDEDGGAVIGELWRVSSEMLAELDEFVLAPEGEEYRRVEVLCHGSLMVGSERSPSWDDSKWAWAWEWKGSIHDAPSVASGDWLDVECPRPAAIYTGLAFLSLPALPFGASKIVTAIAIWLPGWIRVSWGNGFVLVAMILAPILALYLFRVALRRREALGKLRNLGVALTFLWLVGLLIVLAIIFLMAWPGT